MNIYTKNGDGGMTSLVHGPVFQNRTTGSNFWGPWMNSSAIWAL